MEVIATTDLYLHVHGTHGYSRVARSFAAFGGSCAPGLNDNLPFIFVCFPVQEDFVVSHNNIIMQTARLCNAQDSE